MTVSIALPIERILDSDESAAPGLRLGQSREGRDIIGFVFGEGPTHVSLIGGCHADEPVGPAMLEKLVSFLSLLNPGNFLLTEISWRIVPHVNPDGRLRNDVWSKTTVPVEDHRGKDDSGYDLDAYLRSVIREPPGDDIEFGFPRNAGDTEARPENLAVAGFLSTGAPHHLHGSFHGMGFAPGPWFLIEESWIERTGALRHTLRDRVRTMGYELFDPDRKGEKGFKRIDEGFCTRPDSRAMQAFFEARDDEATASKFRPSSMEFVRSPGEDPLTFVSEMPLFLTPPEPSGRPVGIAELQLIRAHLNESVEDEGDCESPASELGIRPMPIRDQQRLQLELLEEALHATRDQR